MAGYRVARAFERIPEITGLELTRHGDKWQGGYYLNGDRHSYRREKLKVTLWKNGIWLFEEGGDCMSLETWLQQYGGARDYWDAIKIIEGESVGFKYDRAVRQKQQTGLYVSPDVLMGAKAYPLEKCSLFRWMCGMFDESKVREVWGQYNVTTDSHGNACFWYTDQDGKVLFDKRILYKEDGHRDKNFFPARQFRVGDGYTHRCYYGANTVPSSGRIFVTESEKSALLVKLMYGKTCVATGGKGNLRDVDSRMLLLPDMDAREEWSEKGDVWPWWERWPGGGAIPDHADIGDMIERKMNRNLE